MSTEETAPRSRWEDVPNDYEAPAGPAYPFVQMTTKGLFAIGTESEANEALSEWAGRAKWKVQEARGIKYRVSEKCPILHVARRSRWLVVSGDGRIVNAAPTYDGATALTRGSARVRSHVQVLAILLGGDAGPFVATLTAKGVQAQHLMALERTIFERCVRPAEREAKLRLPPAAFGVFLGFGKSRQPNPAYDFEYRPVEIINPGKVAIGGAWQKLVAPDERADDVAALLNEVPAWVGAWSEPMRKSDGAGENARHERRAAHGNDAGGAGNNDDIPF